MIPKAKALATVLFIVLIALNPAFTCVGADSFSDSGGTIDLFTQREPYSGRGPNVPCDAFGPEEVVILYALVKYNEIAVQNLLVAFNVKLPSNVSFSLTARTNSSGIATTSFSISMPPINVSETEIFGQWLALANTLINYMTIQDSLTFRADYVIKLISVRTIDSNLTYRMSFGSGGDLGLEVVLRSIAMTLKNTTIAVFIQDELDVVVNSLEICNFEVQPNEKLIYLYCKLYIPKHAFVGKAAVFVSALTASVNDRGVAYCPGITGEFYITPVEPLTIVFHDVAVVSVVPSANSVELGQPLNVNVFVRNEGTEIETFNVSVYLGDVRIGTATINALAPYSKKLLTFSLDTSSFNSGNYLLSAFIPYLNQEADITDNFLAYGVVEIKPKLPVIIHNIGIVDVSISSNVVYVGDLVRINVSVVNKGNVAETFGVNIYYDSSLIGTFPVQSFAVGGQVTLTSVWNTSFVSEGFYQIRASAPLENDVDLLDNVFVDGVIQVKSRPPPSLIHDIAVLNVFPSSTSVYVGGTIDISVLAKNLGNYTESFNVKVFYDSNLINVAAVADLAPSGERTLVFHWNTQNVTVGNHTLSASADILLDEVNFENNRYVDGVVTIVEAPAGWFVPEWFYWFLFSLLLLAIGLVIFWLYYKRRKSDEKAFYSGWTAWYYCYDLRRKGRKV